MDSDNSTEMWYHLYKGKRGGELFTVALCNNVICSVYREDDVIVPSFMFIQFFIVLVASGGIMSSLPSNQRIYTQAWCTVL